MIRFGAEHPVYKKWEDATNPKPGSKWGSDSKDLKDSKDGKDGKSDGEKEKEKEKPTTGFHLLRDIDPTECDLMDESDTRSGHESAETLASAIDSSYRAVQHGAQYNAQKSLWLNRQTMCGEFQFSGVSPGSGGQDELACWYVDPKTGTVYLLFVTTTVVARNAESVTSKPRLYVSSPDACACCCLRQSLCSHPWLGSCVINADVSRCTRDHVS